MVYQLPSQNGGFYAIEHDNLIYDVRPEEIREGAQPKTLKTGSGETLAEPSSDAPVAGLAVEDVAVPCDANSLWMEGVRAYFAAEGGNATAALYKFEQSLALQTSMTNPAHCFQASSELRVQSCLHARRAFFCASLLVAQGRVSEAVPLYWRAVQEDQWLRPAWVDLCLALCDGGDASSARRAAAAAVVEGGFWECSWQRPAAFISGLRSQPFWTDAVDSFLWIHELEANFAAIQSELSSQLPRGAHAPPCWEKVGGTHRRSGQHDGSVVARGVWQEMVLFSLEDDPSAAAGRAAAPVTAGLVERLVPEAVVMAREGAGEVIVSVMAPGTHVASHCGCSNIRLTAHLGVSVPRGDKAGVTPRCGIRVGETWQEWTEGRVLVFDDSYEHEVRNDTDEHRVVLLVRFWHPALVSDEMRHTALTRVQGDLAAAQRLQVLPPLAPGLSEPTDLLEQRLRDTSGACPACGAVCEGSHLSIEEDMQRVVMVSHCCGHIVG